VYVGPSILKHIIINANTPILTAIEPKLVEHLTKHYNKDQITLKMVGI
jgi:hypothetical protein